jgi:hypothetical protein
LIADFGTKSLPKQNLCKSLFDKIGQFPKDFKTKTRIKLKCSGVEGGNTNKDIG